MNLLSRQEAIAAGSVRYFTGRPCAKGHVTERYVKGGACVRCNADSMARWARKNPDGARHWNAHTYAKNGDVIRARSATWARANNDRRRKISKKWADAHKDEMTLYRMSARAKKFGCFDDLTLEELRAIRAEQTNCKYCKCETDLSFDHVKSLAKSGANTKSNLQILCMPCNNAKRTTDEAEFLARRDAA